MNNAVEIAQQLVENEHFRFLLRDAVENMFQEVKNKKEPRQPQYAEVTSVIDQISESLISLGHATVIRQTATLQASIIKRNQELLAQQQIQMELLFKSKIEAIKQQLLEDLKDELRKEIIENNSRKQLLTQQRKVLGQSLLNCSNASQPRYFRSKKGFQDSCIGDVSIENILADRQQTFINDLDITDFTNKLADYQNEQSKVIKNIEINLKKRIDKSQETIAELNQNLADIGVKVDEKVETGFAGLWNVISNIEQKLMALTQAVSEDSVEE